MNVMDDEAEFYFGPLGLICPKNDICGAILMLIIALSYDILKL